MNRIPFDVHRLRRPARRRLCAALLALIPSLTAVGPHAAAQAQASAAAPRTLLVLGDSLSAEYGLRRGSGWVALMGERLTTQRPPWRVVNASISGETSAGGRSRLGELLERHRPSLVVIELGGNDALRGLDLAALESNLSAMVQMARKAGARVLLLGMMMPPNYGRAYAEAFQAVFKRVAEREKAPLVPFLLDGIGERLELFQADRIHPNETAQARMLDNVWPTLQPLLR